MADIKQRIQHLRNNTLTSGSATAPTAAQLLDGEIAINNNATDPSIFIKDTAGNVVQFQPINESTVPAQKQVNWNSTSGVQSILNKPAVLTGASQVAGNTTLRFSKNTNGTASNVDVKVMYDSGITDTMKVSNPIGDITTTMTQANLEAKSLGELIADMLFATVNPSFTAPTASITSTYGSNNVVKEVGTTSPTSASFTKTYNPGAIMLQGVKQNDRAGAKTSETLTFSLNGATATTTLPTTVAWGNNVYTYTASYAAGPQPKNNKGGNYSTPLAAGSVSGTYTVIGTYAVYATTSAIGTLTKQALNNLYSATYYDTTLVAENDTNRWKVQIPSTKTVRSIQFWNTNNNSWEDDGLATGWTVTDTTISGVSYKQYTHSHAIVRGGTKLRFNF